MRLGIKAKQVLGVTSIVGLVVLALSILHLAALARMNLEESQARGDLLASAIFQRARSVVAEGHDPYASLRSDPGIRSLLESSIAYSPSVTYAAIVGTDRVVVVDSDPSLQGRTLPPQPALSRLLARNAFAQLRAIYEGRGRTFEVRQPLLLNDARFGSIRIGVSTLLIRQDLNTALKPAAFTAAAALLIAMVVAMLFAQLLLRPIHVISSGLTRLGRGELGVTLDLKQRDEFGDLGSSFNAVSARLSADRVHRAGPVMNRQTAADRLEEAVGLFGPGGELLFASPAMRAALPPDPVGRPLDELLPAGHPYRRLVEETLEHRQARGPRSVTMTPGVEPEGGAGGDVEPVEWVAVSQFIDDREHRPVGVMVLARNLAYLNQLQSTLTYSHKLAALGRLSAGVAHEVKNPLNAMMIHLELLRQSLAGGSAGPVARRALRRADGVAGDEVLAQDVGTGPQVDAAAALQHAETIAAEIRRLDQVVQGFLKFVRPQEVALEPVRLQDLFEELRLTVEPEARGGGVQLVIDCPSGVPAVSGDPGLLRQVFLNLALNACQAMPHGGTLHIGCARARGQRVEVRVEDTGIGIPPDQLDRIFDLYFTTREQGSGIGLSMVYRIVQLHDGDIEVQSTPGHGTTFRVLLPRADAPPAAVAGLGLAG